MTLLHMQLDPLLKLLPTFRPIAAIVAIRAARQPCQAVGNALTLA